MSLIRGDNGSSSKFEWNWPRLEEVHTVKKLQNRKNWQRKPANEGHQNQAAPKYNQQQKWTSKTYMCRKCGSKHGPRSCPAYGKSCAYCKKPNHFAKVCTRKPTGVHHLAAVSPHQAENENITDDEAEDDFMMDELSHTGESRKKEWNPLPNRRPSLSSR